MTRDKKDGGRSGREEGATSRRGEERRESSTALEDEVCATDFRMVLRKDLLNPSVGRVV